MSNNATALEIILLGGLAGANVDVFWRIMNWDVGVIYFLIVFAAGVSVGLAKKLLDWIESYEKEDSDNY